MMMFPITAKIYISTQSVDMRKSFNGLSLLANDLFNVNPVEGSLFVFLNKPKNKVKILYYDQNGFAIWYKALTKGSFKLLNKKSEGGYSVSMSELNMLLSDIQRPQNIELIKHKIVN